jgi:hypothetical protein
MTAALPTRSGPSPIQEHIINGDTVFIMEAFGIKYKFFIEADAAAFAVTSVLQRTQDGPEHCTAKDAYELDVVDETVEVIRQFGTRYHFRQVERFAKRLRRDEVAVDEDVV